MKQYIESATINGQYVRNSSTTGWPSKTETATLPTGGVRIMELDEVIHPGGALSMTLNGTPAEIVPYSFTPALGKLAVSRPLGLIKWHEDNDGDTLAVSYTPAGTRVTAGKLVSVGAGGGGGAVDSVNGKTGTVVLGMDDFGEVIDDGDGDAYTYKLNEGQHEAVTRLDFYDGGGYMEHEAGPGYSQFRFAGGVKSIDPDGFIGAGTGLTSLPSINNHTDVTITSAEAGQVLQYDGTKWINGRKISHGTTAPSSPAVGDIWLDTN